MNAATRQIRVTATVDALGPAVEIVRELNLIAEREIAQGETTRLQMAYFAAEDAANIPGATTDAIAHWETAQAAYWRHLRRLGLPTF